MKDRAVDITHSDSLELIAKAFGYDNWNVLSAKIAAAQAHAADARALLRAGEPASAPQDTLYCSFCGKSQHDVVKLIAGPSVYICDECAELCMDIVRDEESFWKVLELLTAGGKDGSDADRAAFEHVRGRSTEDVAKYVERSKGAAEHYRVILHRIRRKLATGADETAAEDDALVSRRLDYLNNKSKEELLALQRQMQATLKRCEDAQRIGTTVLSERGE